METFIKVILVIGGCVALTMGVIAALLSVLYLIGRVYELIVKTVKNIIKGKL